MLVLLVLVVLVSGWNVAQDASDFAHFPGLPITNFYRCTGDSCYDYLLNPLGYIMPLGSLPAC